MTNVSAAESATAKLSAKMMRDGLPPILPSTLGNMLADMYAGTHLRAVENRWKSSGKDVGEAKNKHGVVFIWSPRRRTRGVSACRCGPVLQILQNGFGQGHFSSVHTGLNSLIFAARVSSDNPRLKAFWRVAPSVLFKVRAIVPACVLLSASFFKVWTSFAVQVRLRLFMLWSPRSSQNAVSAAVKKNWSRSNCLFDPHSR